MPRLYINKRFFSTILLLIALLSSATAGHPYSNQLHLYRQEKTTISIFVPKQAACGLSYTNLLGQSEMLKFNGLAEKDTVITQSLNLASPTAFVWGFLTPNSGKPGLFLTKYAILANPGDEINLTLNAQHQLNNRLSAGVASLFLADNTTPFYATQTFGNNGKKVNENDSKQAYIAFNNDYYGNLKTAYENELNRLNALKNAGKLDARAYAASNLYARTFFYDKLFVLADESGKYPDAVLQILEKYLPEVEKLLKEPDLILSGEVVRTMSGLVKAKLMNKKIDCNNLLNLYEEGKSMDLGIFKSTFLTHCLANYPAKQVANYRIAFDEFNNNYVGTVYSQYLADILERYNRPIVLPLKEKFTTTESQSFSMNEIVKKASTPFVVVDFWASWCKPCREQFPVIDKLKRELEEMDAPVSFVTINMDESKAKWMEAAKAEMKYLKHHSYHWENAKKSTFIKELNIQAIPYTIVLKDGKVIANNFTLPAELSFKDDLMALINKVTPPAYTYTSSRQ